MTKFEIETVVVGKYVEHPMSDGSEMIWVLRVPDITLPKELFQDMDKIKVTVEHSESRKIS